MAPTGWMAAVYGRPSVPAAPRPQASLLKFKLKGCQGIGVHLERTGLPKQALCCTAAEAGAVLPGTTKPKHAPVMAGTSSDIQAGATRGQVMLPLHVSKAPSTQPGAGVGVSSGEAMGCGLQAGPSTAVSPYAASTP